MKKNSVLIVDDETVNIKALMYILSKDYTVYAEKDGRSCLDTAMRLRSDLILLDVLMPIMDGFEIIKQLKEHEDTKDIPVIFVTGLTGSENEMLGLSLGAVDYIAKPFTASDVKMRVQNQMKNINL